MTKLGFECKLWINDLASGSYQSPQWNEADCVRDLQYTLHRGPQMDLTAWDDPRWAVFGSTRKAIQLTFDLLKEAENDAWKDIHQAWWLDLLLDVMILDGELIPDTEDGTTEGLRAWFQVDSIQERQPLNGVLAESVMMTLGEYDDVAQKPVRETITPP
jgi:hypothetical protein